MTYSMIWAKSGTHDILEFFFKIFHKNFLEILKNCRVSWDLNIQKKWLLRIEEHNFHKNIQIFHKIFKTFKIVTYLNILNKN